MSNVVGAHRGELGPTDRAGRRLMWAAGVVAAMEAGRAVDRFYPGTGFGVAIVGVVALGAAVLAGR